MKLSPYFLITLYIVKICVKNRICAIRKGREVFNRCFGKYRTIFYSMGTLIRENSIFLATQEISSVVFKEGSLTISQQQEPELYLYLLKHFFNNPNKWTSVFLIHLSIKTVLHVSVCYANHLQGEIIITCT